MVIEPINASSFQMNLFKVGSEDQFSGAGSLNLGLFSAATQRPVTLKGGQARLGTIIQLNVTNLTAGALRLIGMLLGPAVRY